jgi:hypothetical protein
MTAERKQIVLDLWRQGQTATKIAAQLHVTKNVVIGIINRLRYSGVDVDPEGKRKPGTGGRPRKVALTPKREPSLPKLEVRKPPRVEMLPPPPKAPPPKAPPPPPPPVKPTRGRWVGFFDNTGCKYPRGGRPYQFCNAPKVAEQSYCPEHQALCWTKVQRKVAR